MTQTTAPVGVQIELPSVPGAKGTLTFVEGERQVPFPLKRAYYLYDIPLGESRGGHAHRSVDVCMIAVSGILEVRLDNGAMGSRHVLDRPSVGLLIPRMVWLKVTCSAPASVCLVLASEFYDEADYIRTYDQFLRQVHAPGAHCPKGGPSVSTE